MNDTTTLSRRSRAGRAPASALPWPALIVLGAATFVMVTAEMLPTAVLPQMSAGLGVSAAQTGLLVSIWAGVVVVGSLPLVRLTRRLDRRTVVVWSLVALALSAVATALAPFYALVVAARIVGALAVGLLWATTNALTADLVDDRDLARGVAVVLGGATLGMVIGTPLANLVAQGVGWRATFAGLAVATLVAAVAVRWVVRPAARATTATASGVTDAAARPAGRARRARGIRPMLAVVALVGLLLVGHYGVYTFITRMLAAAADPLPGGVGTLLLVFGLASAGGVALAGRFGARTERALVIAAVATGLALAALALVGGSPVLGVVVVVVWGVASGAVPPLAQTLMLRLAGAEHRDLAGALIPVVFNLGIAVGAAVASGLVDASGVASLPAFGATVVAASVVGLLLAFGRGRGRAAATKGARA
ncbi:Predicted arabinose efflux permease, MFS family [Agromyces sp. CF514]|uniref:MFS transporter n=1 Tax=Agromyces sp. CF514 TaxID=1881031 RepID=UPI0008EE10B5|nr:MFS transporter [Agromyces sp. CF514]SFR83240.1 Predicted arabinose efflux permease, MFS family [Agromyces sp. CF514]